MSSPAAQFDTSRDMGIYEPFRQITQWVESLKDDITPNLGAIAVVQEDARQENRSDLASHESTEPSGNDQEANRPVDRTQRRLAQNREAARKSRLRKKAYVQQLETSRLKLAQLEQELERARQQGLYVSSALGSGHAGYSAAANSAIAAYEMEYGHWVEEQHRKNCELRTALQAHIGDIELRILVESSLNHYYNLFRIKADVAKADVFYLMSGMWRTSAERFFLWIGGFRPSELLNVLLPQLEPLTERQGLDVQNLRHSSQQTEDALSQGVDKLQQSLAQDILAASMSPEGYGTQMAAALEKLEALEGFVSQADHLRSKTLQQMSRILTTRQAARGLLALGEYFHRLRALSSLWAARPREPT